MIERTTTYYLEMHNASDFKPKDGYKQMLEIKPLVNDVFQQWMLFVGVGLPWRWYSRLSWSPDEWNNYFDTYNPQTFLAFNNNKMAGYFELLFRKNKELEITFLGLFPQSIGAGLGGYLLSHALDTAWNMSAAKVWLHTCTSDHQMALPNYLARGFKVVNEVEGGENIPDKEEYLQFVNNFMSQYIDQQNRFWK